MFGIGPLELVAILVVALLIFGPAKLPELARTLGRGLAEFRRASSELRQSIMTATDEPPAPPPPPQGPADQMAAGAAAAAARGVPAPEASTTGGAAVPPSEPAAGPDPSAGPVPPSAKTAPEAAPSTARVEGDDPKPA